MSKTIAKTEKSKPITLQDVRNHARLTGLNFKQIAIKIGKNHSHVWRVLHEGRASAPVWKLILALPLDAGLVNYANTSKPSTDAHRNIIPDNSQDFNGYFKKNLTVKKIGRKK